MVNSGTNKPRPGRPGRVKEGPQKRCSFSLDAPDHERFKEYLADRHVTMQALLERWIRNAMR